MSSAKTIRYEMTMFGLAVVMPLIALMLYLPGNSGHTFSSGSFMPHIHCYLDNPRVVWLHVLSDFFIGAAYVSISSTLAFLVYKARKDIPFQWMFLGFGLFIISCGGTHFMEIVTVWNPLYWLAGDIKLVTAVASVGTALALPPLLPKVFSLIEAAKASEQRKLDLEKAHAEMEQLNRQLRELDEMKSQFFANVSHELRTPLALILGPAQTLLAENLTLEQHQKVQVVNRNALILLKHVTDLLDASKLEAGKMQLQYSRTDLAPLLRLVTSNFELLARERSIRFTVDAPQFLEAECDAGKIERICTNLLSNAFKFTPEGGKVFCTLRAEKDYAVLTLGDSGPGVPPEFREAIFERFRQVEGGATRRHGGTGLGLAITKDFITLHRGTISVGASPEGGALFTVRLPLKAPAGVELESLPEALSSGAAVSAVEELRQDDEQFIGPIAQNSLGGTAHAGMARSDGSPRQPLVLVIEDNAEMNRFITGTLQPFYRVENAFNGKEGLEKARALVPDLVLVDVMMSEMSGDEVLRALRAEPRFANVPIVLLTAKSDQDLRIRLLRVGAQDYIVKPFLIEELLARVENLLKIKFTRQALETANQELEAFSYSVAHDLRAPLRAIRQLSQVLLEDYGDKLDAEARSILDRISISGARLDSLICDVLIYTRVIRSSVEFEPVELDKLVREVIQQQSSLQANRASISIQSPLLRVLGHPAFLTQCLSNLLENAVKFVAKDKTPEITIRTEPRDSMVRIWVEDNGIGIDPRYHQRLFNMFERAHSDEEYEGTGIGLSIVRKAIERMGGTVGVESEPGKGSRFWIELHAVQKAPTGH